MYRLISYINDRSLADARWRDSIRNLQEDRSMRLRILILWGTKDRVAPLAVATAFQELAKEQMDLTTMEGIGHFAMLEAPEQWTNYVMQHISS